MPDPAVSAEAELRRLLDIMAALRAEGPAGAAILDRLLHHAHVLKCGPRSWRTKIHTDLRQEEQAK